MLFHPLVVPIHLPLVLTRNTLIKRTLPFKWPPVHGAREFATAAKKSKTTTNMTTLCRGVVNDLAWFAGTIRFFLLGKTRSWSLEHDRRTPRRRSSKWGVFNECKQARKKRGKKKAILYEYCAMSIKKDEILNLPGFANFERYLYLRRGCQEMSCIHGFGFGPRF